MQPTMTSILKLGSSNYKVEGYEKKAFFGTNLMPLVGGFALRFLGKQYNMPLLRTLGTGAMIGGGVYEAYKGNPMGVLTYTFAPWLAGKLKPVAQDLSRIGGQWWNKFRTWLSQQASKGAM